ncbi:abortive infection family protein [Lentzea sp. NPDC102401]|uniref:abortive infection family protein n=1 Tax=Lentzea sp. NPDC102401 TaxID=3364128 RepID=UPI00380DCA2E
MDFEEDDEFGDQSELDTAIDLVERMEVMLIATAKKFNEPYQPNRREYTAMHRQLKTILQRHGVRNPFPWSQVDEGVAAAKTHSATYAGRTAFLHDRAEQTIMALRHRISDRASGDLAAATQAFVDAADDSVDITAVRARLRRIEAALPVDPVSALSEAKNLVEVVAKTILAELEVPTKSSWDLGELAKQTAAALGVDRKSATDLHHQDIAAIMKRLQGLVHELGSLRNHAGDGHGELELPEGIDLRHGRLAMRCAIAWSAFMLDTLHDQSVD